MSLTIENKTFDAERALYHLENGTVKNCVFAGRADGESVLKEARKITVEDCSFSLRYPLWHVREYRLINSTLDEMTRAPLWYSQNGEISGCKIMGVKCLRECDRTLIVGCEIISPEFGWRCRDLKVHNSSIESEYLFFEGKNALIDNLDMKGKYSFQYTENFTITNSNLDTKDAFWHSKNVTVENSVVKGEYLGWYSKGLTLVNCKIIGTQPLCYCEDLTLINCTMEETDLSFEYSSVNATVKGNILSVKNPKSGEIIADSIGDIILENSVMETDCKIKTLACVE